MMRRLPLGSQTDRTVLPPDPIGLERFDFRVDRLLKAAFIFFGLNLRGKLHCDGSGRESACDPFCNDEPGVSVVDGLVLEDPVPLPVINRKNKVAGVVLEPFAETAFDFLGRDEFFLGVGG